MPRKKKMVYSIELETDDHGDSWYVINGFAWYSAKKYTRETARSEFLSKNSALEVLKKQFKAWGFYE